MNERNLDVLIADKLEQIRSESAAPLDVDAVMERLQQDRDVQIMLDGYEMHDRSEGLRDVILRDMRRKVAAALGEEGGA